MHIKRGIGMSTKVDRDGMGSSREIHTSLVIGGGYKASQKSIGSQKVEIQTTI
jgi:hypothetical protein